MRDVLEQRQVWIYFAAIVLGAVVAALVPGTAEWERAINPALAVMLFVTFLQVPIAEIGRGLRETRFLAALLCGNFIVIPLLAALLVQLTPADNPLLRLGVLLVLLAPCIDYVITFSHLGRADARTLLAATPILLLVQMLVLPVYLTLLLGGGAQGAAGALVRPGPFVQAFLWLIALPMVLAAAMQIWAGRTGTSQKGAGQAVRSGLDLLPVPATAFVLFLVAAACLPVLGRAAGPALSALPVYIAFAVLAPLAGWGVAAAFGLRARAARAVAFSTATRNSLVVLPLALAVPGAFPVLPAVIVTQTMVELVAEMVYIRVIARVIRDDGTNGVAAENVQDR